MNLIEDAEINCPYCGKKFAIQVNTEAGPYTTTEDCAICCGPITLTIRCRPGVVEGIDVQAE